MASRDWKEVYRRVKSKPVFMKEGRPSSALFKDSKGVSVDRDAGRSLNDIIVDEERLHALYNVGMTEEEVKEKGEELKAIISLTDEQCDSVEVCVIPDPIAGENENHAVIQKSKTEIQLSKSQARNLAKMSTIVKNYA